MEDEGREEEQLALMERMREVRVVLSAMRWNVVFRVADWKGAWRRGPPGREVLDASPYYMRVRWGE